MKVVSIFSTIQGEGSWTGTSATFIRLSHCNLSCDFCDTDFSKVNEMTIDEIISKVKSMPARHIVITGGEPTLQMPDLEILSLNLINNGYFTSLETNGTKKIDHRSFNHVTISPKTNAKMVHVNQEKNKEIKQFICDDLKIVYEGQTMLELEKMSSPFEVWKDHWLQPLSNSKESIEAVARIIIDQAKWRISLQTHKIIGVE